MRSPVESTPPFHVRSKKYMSAFMKDEGGSKVRRRFARLEACFLLVTVRILLFLVDQFRFFFKLR